MLAKDVSAHTQPYIHTQNLALCSLKFSFKNSDPENHPVLRGQLMPHHSLCPAQTIQHS